MVEKRSKLKQLIEKIYFVGKLSVLFWVSLFRKGLVYAWVATIQNCLECAQERYIEDESIWKWSGKKREQTLITYMISFLMTLTFFGIFASWMSMMRQVSELAITAFVFSSILWCILFLFATALALGKGGKEETNFSLFRKDPLFAVTLFLGLCAGIWFSLTKNIIGWFLFPGLYFYLVILVKKMKEQ